VVLKIFFKGIQLSISQGKTYNTVHLQKMDFAASTNSMTPHIKKKNCTKKNINPPTADFHLKKKEEKRKNRREVEKEEGFEEKEEEEDVGMQTHGAGAVDPRPA
jgi:hypothetical protein